MSETLSLLSLSIIKYNTRYLYLIVLLIFQTLLEFRLLVIPRLSYLFVSLYVSTYTFLPRVASQGDVSTAEVPRTISLRQCSNFVVLAEQTSFQTHPRDIRIIPSLCNSQAPSSPSLPSASQMLSSSPTLPSMASLLANLSI